MFNACRALCLPICDIVCCSGTGGQGADVSSKSGIIMGKEWLHTCVVETIDNLILLKALALVIVLGLDVFLMSTKNTKRSKLDIM